MNLEMSLIDRAISAALQRSDRCPKLDAQSSRASTQRRTDEKMMAEPLKQIRYYTLGDLIHLLVEALHGQMIKFMLTSVSLDGKVSFIPVPQSKDT